MGSRGIRSGPIYNPPTESRFDSHNHSYGGLSSVGPAQAHRTTQGHPSYRDGASGAQPGLRYNVHPPSPQTHRRTHTQPVVPPLEDLFARAQASRTRFDDREYLDHQRMGAPRNQLRPVHISDTAVHQTEFEDDRLVISWVDESELADPPAAPTTRPSLGVLPPSRPVSYLSDGETLLGSGLHGRSPNDRVSSGGSYGFPTSHADGHRYPDYESDSDSGADPSPAILTPPPEWPAPRDRLRPGPGRTAYPSLPIPQSTVTYDPQTESPVEEEPRPEFKESFDRIHKNDAAGYLEALSFVEMDRSHADRALRKLNHAVQVQFEERQGVEKVNRVVVIPRNRPALAVNPKIDVDLIVPGDFVLHQWSIRPRPATVAHALGLDSTSLARSEISASKLKHVIQAIWDQFDAGGRTDLQLEDGPDTHHLRLLAPGRVSVRINVFIKVATSIHGKDVLLGVDSNSALSGDKYQMIQNLPAPGVSFTPSPLSHVERIAILTLTWWQREIKQLPAGEGVTRPRLRTSHFMLALAALHQLDPTNELYLAPNGVGSKFSLVKVLETMEKVLNFMERAYESPFASSASSSEPVKYPFPLACCTVTDALYTQATVNPNESIQTTRLVLREMALGIHGTIEDVQQLEEKSRKERKESGSLKEFELLAKVSGLLGRPATVRMSNQERFKHELEERKPTTPMLQGRSLTMAPGGRVPLSPVPESPRFRSPLVSTSLRTDTTGGPSPATQGSPSADSPATPAAQNPAPVVTPPKADASAAVPAPAPAPSSAATLVTAPAPTSAPATATADQSLRPDNSSTLGEMTLAEGDTKPAAPKDKPDGQKAEDAGADAASGTPTPAGGADPMAKQSDSELTSG